MIDLNMLEQRHRDEEAEEAGRDLADRPRPLGASLPEGGTTPASTGWLTRLYEGNRVAREKKPVVFDHLRSYGPWMVSVDEVPLSVLDGMSQTATLPGGFAPDGIVAAYFDGAFGPTLTTASGSDRSDSEQAEAYRAALRARIGEGLPHISFTSSGAEANEKAFALCRNASGTERNRVLAFEGSFHGRTLLALHSTWNPAKREPFELKGYESRFAPFPVRQVATGPEPDDPPEFRALLAAADLTGLERRYAGTDDVDLRAEIASLAAVDRQLSRGDVFACIVEAMQSEGGDRYATGRFFRGLRLLTRAHGVPLIFDEVQTGFGLGGTFLWHHRFGLVDEHGKPDYPDAVTMAKRAQVGLCASRFVDPEPTAAHPASLVRGRLHVEMIDDGTRAKRVETMVRKRLDGMSEKYGDLVSGARVTGYASAFDLPTPEHLAAYLGQRFWRGAVVFGAGQKTVRYRLSESWGDPEIDLLFDAVKASLAWLCDHPGERPPAWEDTDRVVSPHPIPPSELPRVRAVEPAEADAVLEQVLALERRIFEPARRDPEARLRRALEDPDGVAVIAEAGSQVIGYAFAVPLEAVGEMDGPKTDPLRGREKVLYSVAVSVDPDYRGKRLGGALKAEQIRVARDKVRPDGSRRYQFITGRNRVGEADAMTRLNRRFGAYVVNVLDNQYGEADAQALYYRIPLRPFTPPVEARRDPLDLSAGVTAPFADGPDSLTAAQAAGLLFGAAVNKLTLCNYATPASIRGIEWVSALTPELPHLFLTSSRDELIDKSVRILRWHRPDAQIPIGLEGGYVGHTSAVARSLSDPALHRQGPALYRWPRVPHPGSVGNDATMTALDEAVASAGGPDRVLGVFVEPLQERTGRLLPPDFCEGLSDWRSRTGIPLISIETASAFYRSGTGPFAGAALGIEPDLQLWWGGAQLGFVHIGAEYFVDKPLAMISTWDGDELSLIRLHHQLRAARRLDIESLGAELEAALATAPDDVEVRGLGLYQLLVGPGIDRIERALNGRGVMLRRAGPRALLIAPPLDRVSECADRLREALATSCCD
jgi:4-aminobutyrate aminotransferase-like enzyme/GNAT superfamily N-acetyltransferase